MVYSMTRENQKVIENPLYLLFFLFFWYLARSFFLGFYNVIQCFE